MNRDEISVESLSLRCSKLSEDLWLREARDQPLFVTLAVSTDIQEEAGKDNLLDDSLNYGKATKLVEGRIKSINTESRTWALEELAEELAQTILFKSPAQNVNLSVVRPRALLQAESVTVSISRSRADYLPVESGQLRQLSPKSANSPRDRFAINKLRRSIVIGINACERLDEQEVIVEFEFGVPEEEMLTPWKGLAPREGWKGWRAVVKECEKVRADPGMSRKRR